MEKVSYVYILHWSRDHDISIGTYSIKNRAIDKSASIVTNISIGIYSSREKAIEALLTTLKNYYKSEWKNKAIKDVEKLLEEKEYIHNGDIIADNDTLKIHNGDIFTITKKRVNKEKLSDPDIHKDYNYISKY